MTQRQTHTQPNHQTTRYTKGNLPQKTCAACARPFAWRKKWARDWEQVRFCSQRCRNSKAHSKDIATS